MGADKVVVDIITNTDKSNKSILKFAAGVGAATVALTAMAKIGKDLVNAYAVQEQAEAKLNQTILSTGSAANLTSEQLLSMASGLQDVTKFSDETIIGAESLLLTFKDIGEDTFPRALESILDVSEAMGQDLKSSTVQIGKALNDPIAGLAALSRVGIQFTDDQKDMITEMVNMNDKAGAQAVILQELESQFGGVARAAADTATGGIAQLGNSIGDLQEIMGSAVVDTIDPFIDTLDDVVVGLGAFITQMENTRQAQLALTAGTATQDQALVALTNNLVMQKKAQESAIAINESYGESYESGILALENQIAAIKQAMIWEEKQLLLTADQRAAEEEQAKINEEKAADMAYLLSFYEKTAEYEQEQIDNQKEMLRSQIALFESWADGPKTTAVIKDLTEQLEALGAVEETVADEAYLVNQTMVDALSARSEGWQDYYVLREEQRAADLAAEKAATDAQIAMDREVLSAKASLFGGLSQLAGVWAEDSKAMFIASQVAASAEAGINSYLAFTEALTMGPVLGPIMGASVLASGLAAQASILSTPIPGYATGGFHSGGWRIVGENGPELENTGPSQIFSNSQSKNMLGGNNYTFNISGVVNEDLAVEIENKIMSARARGLI